MQFLQLVLWHRKKLQIPIFGYFRLFKEYPQKSHIWKSETSPNQGTWLGIPWLGLVSLCQIWNFYGYSLNTLKYPKMGICYFFLCGWIPSPNEDVTQKTEKTLDNIYQPHKTVANQHKFP